MKLFNCDKLLACLLLTIIWLVIARFVFVFWLFYSGMINRHDINENISLLTKNSFINENNNKYEMNSSLSSSYNKMIKHQWTRCNNKRYVVLDTYIIKFNNINKPQLIILGVGNVTMKSSFICDYTYEINSRTYNYESIAIPRINGTVYGNPQKVDMYVLWFMCDLPSKLLVANSKIKYGETNGQVTLRNKNNQHNNDFKCENLKLKWYTNPILTYKVTLCTSCVYGLKSNRWLIEYLEYYRAIGVNRVELYQSKLGKQATATLIDYRRNGFVTSHDWDNPVGHRGVGYGVRLRNWEHGQILTRNDCYLRNYGVSNFIMIADIDELWVVNSTKRTLFESLEYVSKFNEKHFAFNAASVTIPPYLYKESKEQSINLAKQFIVPFYMAHLITEEKKCRAPFNCGKYHYGRQKFALKTTIDTSSTLTSIWYHAVSIEYDIANICTTQIPSNILYIRHYNRQFPHLRNGLTSDNRKIRPIDSNILKLMSSSLELHPKLLQQYRNSDEETLLNLNNLINNIVK